MSKTIQPALCALLSGAQLAFLRFSASSLRFARGEDVLGDQAGAGHRMLLPGTTVDGSELLALALAQAFLAPELFARKFPHGHWHDLYAFLTPLELARLLCDVPQVAELLDMEDVAEKPAPDRWLAVITAQPQLEKYFDWALVEKKSSIFWDDLLRHQPQFACHCDPEQLKAWQIRRIQRRQPQLFSKG